MRPFPRLVEMLTTERLVAAILFAAFVLGISGYSSDVFLHLSTGRLILAMGMLPAGDPFSFTRPGAAWVMHEWLWQILLYAIYAGFGYAGLKLLGATVLAAALHLNHKSCKRLGATPLMGWMTVITLMLAWLEFIGVRPHILTYLFFALTLQALLTYRHNGTPWLLYLIPLVMPLWVNSHGGFIVGIVLIGYFLLVHTLELRLMRGRWCLPWPLLAALVLSLGTSLLNPYGYRQLLFPFQMMNKWALGYITEWQPLDLASWQGLLFMAGVALLGATLPLLGRTERLFRLALLAPFCAAALLAVRHLPLAIFIMTPFLASQLTLLMKQRAEKSAAGVPAFAPAAAGAGKRPRNELGQIEYLFNWLILGGLGLAIGLAWPTYARYAADAVHRNFPIDATRYLDAHHVTGRMFASMEFSSYILFARTEEQRLFYDVRVEIYGERLARDYITMAYALDGWQRLFRMYRIDYAVLDKTRPIYRAMLNDPGFIPVYEDGTSAIFLADKTSGGVHRVLMAQSKDRSAPTGADHSLGI